jgi:hypothetical protein
MAADTKMTFQSNYITPSAVLSLVYGYWAQMSAAEAAEMGQFFLKSPQTSRDMHNRITHQA